MMNRKENQRLALLAIVLFCMIGSFTLAICIDYKLLAVAALTSKHFHQCLCYYFPSCGKDHNEEDSKTECTNDKKNQE